ncbi:MAG: SPOR domain-containing protein, partial [Alphaproteobacteria bacterium]
PMTRPVAPPPPPPAASVPATPIAPPSVMPAPDAAAPNGTAAGKYRIQLAAVRESAAAQREWDKLKSTHGEVLGRLSGQIVRVDLGEPRGVFFRIQAGPFGDADQARRACTALKERNVGCLVVRP